ncbi:MAG TPA: hypothetical protein VFW62_06785, partial [bacterium]|nr:hypothetical protein [bacterium]
MGAQIQTETGPGIGPKPTPAGDEFSASRLTASLLGLPSFASLSSEQVASFQEQIGHGLWAELQSLTKERDAELFYSGILHLGGRLQGGDKPEWAQRLYALVAGQNDFPELAQRAKTSIAALEGRGEIGARAEVLVSRVSKDFRDPAMIAPMMIGTSVGSLARGVGLSRLAATPAAWYSRGLGASATAGGLSFAAEVPAFVLSGRALRAMSSAPQATWGQDFSTGALSLGAIKVFGAAGKQGLAQLHGVNEFGVMTRGLGLARYSHPLVNQAALFGGLMSAHSVETKLGLRPQVDDATAVTDTLASMISLGAGARLGRGLLGESYARRMHELEWRTRSVPKAMPLPTLAFELPRLNAASAAAVTGLGVLLRSPLAHASDGRWNSTNLTASILCGLAVGGTVAYGIYRGYRANVAPTGPVKRLNQLGEDIRT